MNLYEAYASVYLEEDFDTLLDDISDEELSEIVEEVVASAIEEGYELEEIEECFGDTLFDQVISEARVTSDADRPGGGAKVTTGQGSRMVAKDRLAKRTAEKRAERRARVKAAVKTGVDKVKAAPGKAAKAAKEAGREAKFKAVDKKVAAYANKRNLHPAPGMAARSKDPAKRRGLRAKVAKDIASRVKSKVKSMKDTLSSAKRKAVKAASDVAVKAYNKGREVKQAASDAKNKAGATLNRQAVKAARATDKAEKGVKKGLGRLARGIADKAGKAASRLGEEVDSFDIVLDYLIIEGHAETEEAAIKIMATMSDEWRTEILEAYELDEAKGTILSVKGGGKTKYAASSKDQRAAAKSAAQRSNAALRKKSGKNIANDARAEQARKKSIEAMNSKPGEESGDYDTGYYGDDDLSGGKRHYSYGRTNRAARARRASGR